jgi:hypothetical protein
LGEIKKFSRHISKFNNSRLAPEPNQVDYSLNNLQEFKLFSLAIKFLQGWKKISSYQLKDIKVVLTLR